MIRKPFSEEEAIKRGWGVWYDDFGRQRYTKQAQKVRNDRDRFLADWLLSRKAKHNLFSPISGSLILKQGRRFHKRAITRLYEEGYDLRSLLDKCSYQG